MGKKNRKASSENLWLLATNVKRLREARGYSQLELARRTGLTNGYISKVEQELKNVTLANLGALAIGLGCSLEDLFRPPPKKRDPSVTSTSVPTSAAESPEPGVLTAGMSPLNPVPFSVLGGLKNQGRVERGADSRREQNVRSSCARSPGS